MLRRPIATNRRDKPVVIFKNDQELKELPHIQAAALWLKDYAELKSRPYTIIENGMYLGETWTWNGDRYNFTTDESVRREKLRVWKEEGRIKQEKVLPTGCWTFFCNPNKWAMDQFLLSGKTNDSFSVTAWQKDWFEIGQFGVIRVGNDTRSREQLNGLERMSRGIYAIVQVTGLPEYRSAHDPYYYEAEDKKRYHVPIRYVYSNYENPIRLDDWELEPRTEDVYLMNGFQASSMPLNPATFQAICEKWNIGDELNSLELPDIKLTEELNSETVYMEGSAKQVIVNAYERNSKARQACLAKHGYDCSVCGFNFAAVYGELGDKFIHVHHLKEIHTIKEEYVVDPIHDLIPVCPNCHAMLHRKSPPYTLQELRTILRQSH